MDEFENFGTNGKAMQIDKNFMGNEKLLYNKILCLDLHLLLLNAALVLFIEITYFELWYY